MSKSKTEATTYSSKAMLLENAEKRTKIKYADRLNIEIITATRHYKVGTKVSPHRVKAEALIKAGIAKELK